MKTQPLYQRILARIGEPDARGCWPWLGTVGPTGYGSFTIAQGARRLGRPAHRLVFELFRHPIPEGLEIDHRCRNRACVNPDHLDAVTHTENMRRAAKTHCPHGHRYTPANTWVDTTSGARRCRACMRDRQRKYRERKAAA